MRSLSVQFSFTVH